MPTNPSTVTVVGSYRMTFVTGACSGIAAGGALFAARWSDTTYSMRLRAIEVSQLVLAGYTAAQEVGFDIIIGRTWSASPTGGTAATLTGGQELTGMGATRFAAGDVRIATTSALTQGTVTLDANPLSADGAWALATTAGGSLYHLYQHRDQLTNVGNPISRLGLAAQDGVLVRNRVAQGAGGTTRWAITMEWDEVL